MNFSIDYDKYKEITENKFEDVRNRHRTLYNTVTKNESFNETIKTEIKRIRQ